jgi:hypothetical protein
MIREIRSRTTVIGRNSFSHRLLAALGILLQSRVSLTRNQADLLLWTAAPYTFRAGKKIRSLSMVAPRLRKKSRSSSV